jgi:hypothetical protein
VCKLFSPTDSAFNTGGFNDCKHAFSRLKVSVHADHNWQIQFNNDRQYWKEVLKRIVEVIKFLASRGLPLRPDNQTMDSVGNGNYLGIMELLCQFDPFLCEHIKKYGNAG